MTPLESIFYMMWRGLAVGVLISAPMGPVGILCIQRTLDRGRKAGFSTGIGAALSDLFYCLLTGFGLSFIEDFLQENSNVIQLFGSLVLIAFSIYLFKKNPSSSLRRPVPQNVSVKKNILGGFLFTFSNPLIIFLIIGLFARFNFTAPEIQGGFYAIGYVFIIVGALAWWYGVTYLINKVRTRFNMRSMKRLNIAIGIVILAFACVGIVSSIIGLTSHEAKAAHTPVSFVSAVSSVSSDRYQNISLRPEGMSASGEWTASADHNDSSADAVGQRSVTLFPPDGGEPAGEEYADIDTQAITDWSVGFRLADVNSHPMRSYSYVDSSGSVRKVRAPGWRLVIRSESGNPVEIKVKTDEVSVDPATMQRALIVEVSRKGDFFYSEDLSYKTAITRGVDTSDGWNAFKVSYSPASGLTLRAGNHGLGDAVRVEGSAGMLGALRTLTLEPMPGGRICMKYPRLEAAYSPGASRSELTHAEIAERVRLSNDIAEGYWELLDYSLEESKVRLGGRYRVAIIRNPAGYYDIIYLKGGNVNGASWEEGMIKGWLKPSGLTGVYDVRWRDSSGRSIPAEVKAQIEGDVMTIFLPDADSRIRLVRLEGI